MHPNSASNRGTKGKGMPCCSSRQGSGLGKASQPSSLEEKRTEGHPYSTRHALSVPHPLLMELCCTAPAAHPNSSHRISPDFARWGGKGGG